MAPDNPSPEGSISDLRSLIDAIDTDLLTLINKRLATAKEIGRIKSMKRLKVQDRAREREVLGRLDRLNPGPIKTDDLHHLFMEIIGITREIQSTDTIAYLGPEATLTHMAALQQFGHSAPLKPFPSLLDIFRDVERGSSRYGVLPVENAVEGAINYALEHFLTSELRICGERYLTATHDLLSKDVNLSQVKEVLAHPHTMAQCRGWLRKHLPDADLREAHSTVDAVGMALARPASAAIGNSAVAHLYQLKTLVSSIEDVRQNVTRFLIIGRDETERTGNDKTSLLFVAPNVPGALHRVLKPLDDEAINMVKLESRPLKQESWNFLFFADIEGHESEEKIQRAAEKMRPFCLFLKILGAYPASSLEGGDSDGR
jgi:chorismate mutase/prephenate dehydratase